MACTLDLAPVLDYALVSFLVVVAAAVRTENPYLAVDPYILPEVRQPYSSPSVSAVAVEYFRKNMEAYHTEGVVVAEEGDR